MGHPSS